MPAVVSCEKGWSMIPVIVLGSQIDHTILHLVPSLLCRVEDSLNHGHSFFFIFGLFFGLEPEKELIEPILMALDAIDGARGMVNVSVSQDLAITRRAERQIVCRVPDSSCAWFQFSSEKLIECLELIWI